MRLHKESTLPEIKSAGELYIEEMRAALRSVGDVLTAAKRDGYEIRYRFSERHYEDGTCLYIPLVEIEHAVKIGDTRAF